MGGLPKVGAGVLLAVCLSVSACSHAESFTRPAVVSSVEDLFDESLDALNAVERSLPPSVVELTRCALLVPALARVGASPGTLGPDWMKWLVSLATRSR